MGKIMILVMGDDGKEFSRHEMATEGLADSVDAQEAIARGLFTLARKRIAENKPA